MDIIRKCVQDVVSNVDLSLCYTEANLQRSLSYFLSEHGSVQCEVIIPYYFEHKCKDVYYGSGRADIIWDYKGETHIIELKRTDKQFNEASFYSQVKKYVKHFNTNKTKNGILVVFCPGKTICRFVCGTTAQ